MKKLFSYYSTVYLCSHVTFLLIVSLVNGKEVGFQSSDNALQNKQIDSDTGRDRPSSNIEMLTTNVLSLIPKLKKKKVRTNPLYNHMLKLIPATHPYSNTRLLYSKRSSSMSMFMTNQKIRQDKLRYSTLLSKQEAETSVDKSNMSLQINNQSKRSSYSKNSHNLTSLRNISSFYKKTIVSPSDPLNRTPTLTTILNDHWNQYFGGHKHKRFVLINNHSGSVSNGTNSSWITKMKPGSPYHSWMNIRNPESQSDFYPTWMTRIRPISQNSHQFQPMIVTNNHKGDKKYKHKVPCKHTENHKNVVSNTNNIVLIISNVNNESPDSVTSKPVTVIDVEPNGTKIDSRITHKVLIVSVTSNQTGEGMNGKRNASSSQLQKDKADISNEDSNVLDDLIQKPVTDEEPENSVSSLPPTNGSEMMTLTSSSGSLALDLNSLSTNTPYSSSSDNGPPAAVDTVSLTNMGTNSNQFLPNPSTSSTVQVSNSILHPGSEVLSESSSDIIQNIMNTVKNGFPLITILRTISIGVILMLIPPGLAGLGMFLSGLFIS